MFFVKYLIYISHILIQPFINLYETIFWKRIKTDVDKEKDKFILTPEVEPKEKLGLFLIHGIGSHPHVFINYIQNVINAGFYVYGALLPGHFTSPAHLARVRRDAWIDSILDQYDVFSKQVDKVVIIGHSLGAIIALDLATKRKNYGLIVIAAPIIPKAFLLRVAKPIIFLLIYTFKYYVFSPKKIQHYEDLGVEVYHKHPFRTFDEMFKMAKEIEPNLGKISSPTLLIIGDKDELVSKRTHDLLRDKIKSELIYEWVAPHATHAIFETSKIK